MKKKKPELDLSFVKIANRGRRKKRPSRSIRREGGFK